MCFSSLVLSRRPRIFKKRPKTLKNPLTPIGSCRDLHRSEGFPRTGLFHTWARWGGLVAGKSSVSSSRDRARARPYHVAIKCKSRHEPIGVRGFLRVWALFLKILGRHERTKDEKHKQDAPYFPILQSYSEMPRILNAIVYPSLIPGPYPESLTRNKCHLMEALYGVVPYKASITLHLRRPA